MGRANDTPVRPVPTPSWLPSRAKLPIRLQAARLLEAFDVAVARWQPGW